MAMLYQLSYNGVMTLPPATCSGTEQVFIDLGKVDFGLALAISHDFEEDLVFTINHGFARMAILG